MRILGLLNNVLSRSSGNKANLLPKGTTAQRPTGESGDIRFNTTTGRFEGYNGTTWVNLDETGGGGGSSALYWYGELSGTAASQIGALAKASETNSTANPSGKRLTDPNNGGLNQGVAMGYICPESGLSLKELTISFYGASVGTGTVGSPTVRFRFFRQNDTNRTQILEVDVPISPTGVGTFSNPNVNAFQDASIVLNTALDKGKIYGWEFVNQSGTNDGINAINKLVTVVKVSS